MISALFVRKDSIYKELGLDCWDLERNAKLFKGSNPVICHPPCGQWGRLRGLASVDPEQKELAFFAIEKIRKNGGVLEHPESSQLFLGDILPVPGQYDKFGGFSMKINQSYFGHPARKRTYLYFYGIERFELLPCPISFDLVYGNVANMSKKLREHTPVNLAKWLIENLEKI